MEKKKKIKKIEKDIGIKKVKSTVRSINAALGFFIFLAVYSIYLNHSGWLLSYGIIVASVSLIFLALFLSYRIKLQLKLNNMVVDYREFLVKPAAELAFENGSFSRTGSLTERDIVSSLMFSDLPDYKYVSCNELKGTYKGIPFSNSDVEVNYSQSNFYINGRFFEFERPTKNINPVVFTNATAPIIEYNEPRVHMINPSNIYISRMFRVYAYDEKEAEELLTDSMIHNLRELVSLQLGKILKISFLNDKVYVFYTTDRPTYKEDFTKKNDVKQELRVVQEEFNYVGKIIDIL
ncbi:MAG: DUF3137 domain-containing protein [Eubacterium sp.]|nr:DUF3137 domain-containing protein [Eubacterium sp.]